MPNRERAEACIYVRSENGGRLLNPRIFPGEGEINEKTLVDLIESQLAEAQLEMLSEVKPGIYRHSKSIGTFEVLGVALAWDRDPKGKWVVTRGTSLQLNLMPEQQFIERVAENSYIFIESR